MPRLRNVRSGVEVNVSDEDAARLGGGYERAGEKKAEAKPAKRAAKKSDEKS